MSTKGQKNQTVTESAAVYGDAALSDALTDAEVRREVAMRLGHVCSDLTNEQAGRLMGVSPRSVTNYLTALRAPSAESLARIALSGWNINWLLTGVGPERMDALNQSASIGPGMQPEMMQKAVESAIGVFKRFNKTPTASQLARASVLLYLMFTDSEPDPTQPVDQLLARIMGEPVVPDPFANFPKSPNEFVGF